MLKRHLAYNPELDRQDKAEEMRQAYEARMADRLKEGNKMEEAHGAEDEEEISSSATSFFEKTPRLKAQNPTIQE